MIPVAPNAPSAEACISAEVERELACRPDDVRVSPDIPPWPSGDFLFHYPPRPTWVNPVLPAGVASDVAKLALTQPSLQAAEKAFDAALAKSASLEERDNRKHATALEPSWRAARDAYSAVLKVLPADDALRAYVHARVALLSENLGQFDDALAAVVSEMDVLRTHPASIGVAALAERAPFQLARAYARSKRAPDGAGAFKDEEHARIAAGYVDAMRYDAARTVLDELAKRVDPARACVVGAEKLSTWIAQSPGAGDRLVTRAQEQRKLLELTDAESCRAATAAVVEEIATSMHIDAVGWKGVRGSGDRSALARANMLYQVVTDVVRARELPRTSLPWLAEEQRPTLFRLELARADLSLQRQDYDHCDTLFESPVSAPLDPTSLAAAIARITRCYANALERAGPSASATPFDDAFLSTSARYLCTVQADGTAIALARGRVLFRKQDWEKTAFALAKLAFVPGRSEAREAAAMYLVALYRMRETSRRQSCWDDLERDRARLLALHCSGADEDAPIGPTIQGLTVSDPRRAVSPCEAMRNLGAPPPPLPEPPPKPRAPRFHGGDSTVVNGNAVPEVIAWATRIHVGQFEACYDLALGRNPYVSGREWLTFVIARDGSVSTARAGSDDHHDGELDACITRVAASMSFAQPEGGLVEVRWSLALDRVRGVRLSGEPTIRQDAGR